MTLPLWLRNQIVRLQKARTRRHALAQGWEVVTCACGTPYGRLVQPHPVAYCQACEATQMQDWAVRAASVRRVS